ncbi:N-acylglucosamine 2-epimerase [Nocardioides szechwanensis]|uniref:Mannose or cellobiose epimerase, N-acyl-D-glucosamine 2-epimerase family n=1 Tax=Nocardioides szechwanensis TaxID=1005944 RepID=A0A1H0CA65_9ACTN|nr:AGE family epimerase/isomerase [Nocardioides szechwanensis]GEP33488.1 N-acylglucosamine 2-epimerase [Nocardioides szechwanensis]SDN54701.1 Mannose or cellobiose epimerase, N-acyl-D-glucosamine 2-epimerase family [Nocardioides szechwanensis]
MTHDATPGGPAYLANQRADLLRFARGARRPSGFGYLDALGSVDRARPVELWITCRMTHVFALGLLAAEDPAPGGPDAAELRLLAEHGVRSLRTSLFDHEHGGWFAAVDDDGVVDASKQAYGHAFVVLAASSAAAAGIDGGRDLLADALACLEEHFWDDAQGLVVDQWDRAWTHLDPYRGINANMHTVEALLAAGDVTGDQTWHERAGRVAERVVAWAGVNQWRIPEHFDEQWQPLLEHHRDEPAHPFQPYGATVGHGLEWARLLVAVAESLGDAAPAGLLVAASELAERAVADGWAVDGAEGFVYTTDWQGAPVVRARMHWVAAEAVNTAEVLWRATGDLRWQERREEWWAHIDRCLVDHERGSWTHELDEHNRPSGATWPGKPDVYHAYQAALLPLLPLTPSFAAALATRV